MSEPRVWAMPAIPADVTQLSAVGGDLRITRISTLPVLWSCVSVATGRELDLLSTGQLLARYSPVSEVVDGDR